RIVAEDGFYPSSREVDQAYVQKHRPTLVRRLAQASRRLAETLNRVAAAR
ncbi:MAG: S1/P1 Nuclease, partial [Betaproteobacteria bacterium]|nr:S1/P1 Nuclease [Betaproteobacteria bacterium]